MLRRIVSRPGYLSVKPHLGPKTRFYYCHTVAAFFDMESPLWREDGSVFYSSCWASPAQSFSGPSLAGPYLSVSDLRLPNLKGQAPYFCLPETGWPSCTSSHRDSFVASYYQQGYSASIETSLHVGELFEVDFAANIPLGIGFPFRCLLRFAGLRWRYSIPPPHGIEDSFL
jgi:hypothetical protein